MELIDKAEILAEIKKIKERIGSNAFLSEYEKGINFGREDVCDDIIYSLNNLEVKVKIEESEQNEDIEQYARNEADKFASKEYEYHNDIRLLSKGFYWGCKAGANWQEQQIKKRAIYGIVAGRVKDEVFVASRWFKDDKLKPAEDIKLIIIKK